MLEKAAVNPDLSEVTKCTSVLTDFLIGIKWDAINLLFSGNLEEECLSGY